MVTLYSKRVCKALRRVSYDKVLDIYEGSFFVEITVSVGGDTLTKRVYDDGSVTER